MTTNHTLAAMRAQAAAGATMADCARALGLTRATVEYWDRRGSIGFVRYAPHAVAPDVAAAAMARLSATWRRLCDAAGGTR